MNKQSVFIVGAFLAGGTLGVVAGFKLAEQRLMDEFNEAVDTERAAARAMYASKQPYASPQEAVSELIVPEGIKETLEAYRGPDEPKEPIAYHKIKPSTVKHEAKPEEERPEPVHEENIFDKPVEQDDIHVISKLEFEYGGSENEKVSMMWYVEDEVLADSTDDMYKNPEDVLGNCLNFFGSQSEDENVVFVRNTRINVDYEVNRSPGSYWQEVHGMEPPEPRPSQSGG